MTARFSSSSKAISDVCRKTSVWPRTVTEVMGPYSALCLDQWKYSGKEPVGRSLMLPTRGSGLGPGGRGGPLRLGVKRVFAANATMMMAVQMRANWVKESAMVGE
jgi:hypothetical protein